jgi:hypothetical protein
MSSVSMRLRRLRRQVAHVRRTRALPLAPLVALVVALVGISSTSASRPLYDANVTLLSLKANGKGEALVTYRRGDGHVSHVLAWGALNARPPVEGVPQVQFRFDHAGGWGKYRNGKYWKTFKNRCRPYDGPKLALFVAGCKAPDGTYWTVQAWQRLLPNLGFDPWLPYQTDVELHLAHFSGELPVLEVYRNWTYGGAWQGIFGRLTYLGVPVYGFGATDRGVPKDFYGRNLHIDTLNSAYGEGWKREAGILLHKGTGTFCHSFVPQKPFAWYPSQAQRPAAPGERYRVTVSGPGVTPVLQVEVPGLTGADKARDAELNAVFDRVMAGDRVCTPER